MTLLSGIGTVLILVLGCLLVALIAELYYLLWWKKQRICSSNSNSNSNRIGEDYSNHTNEMFYLFCWDKPNSIQTHPISNPTTPNRVINHHDQDLEMGLESVESEIMRLYNLAGPPRFLFTIKEETKEDLECDDLSRKASRNRSLSDLILAIDSKSPFLSPMPSPHTTTKSCSQGTGNMNHHLKPSVDADEVFKLRASPPPKFKFLRDAEEKLYRRLFEEAQKSGNLQEGILDNSYKDGILVKSKVINNCSSQVLHLVSSPPNQLH